VAVDFQIRIAPRGGGFFPPAIGREPPEVGGILRQRYQPGCRCQDDAAGTHDAQRVPETPVEIAKVLQRIRQQQAIVRGGRKYGVGSREVAQVRRRRLRDDVERIGPFQIASESRRIRPDLHLQNVAGDQIAVPIEELVQIVPIDRRPAFESVGAGKRLRAPQVAPARAIVTARHAAQRRRQARSEQPLHACRDGRHAAYNDRYSRVTSSNVRAGGSERRH
jgi:hypothetical protein